MQVRIQAGAQPATVGIDLKGQEWPSEFPYRDAIVRLGPPALVGAGTMRDATSPPSNPVSVSGGCFRGPSPAVASSEVWLEIPAGETSFVRWSATMAAPPWPGVNHLLSVSSFAFDDPAAPRTLHAVPPFTVQGLSGVEAETEFDRDRPPPYYAARGLVPPVVGRTDPPLVRKRIVLRAKRTGKRSGVNRRNAFKAKKVRRVRTDSRGRFRAPATPFAHAGRWRLIAIAPATRSTAPDHSCGPTFSSG